MDCSRIRNAIIATPGGGCAIIDLHSPLLHWGAFDFTLEEAKAKLAQPGAIDSFRAYIADQRLLLPFS